MNDLRDQITKKLLDIITIVNVKNKMNLTDINIMCEHLFCEILNIIFNLELTVLNIDSNGRNIAVDLGDEERSIYIQVTSNKRLDKIQETIRKFSCKYGKESTIIMFIIGKKKSKYGLIDTYGTDFNINTDVWDICTIINNLNDDNERNKKILFALDKFYDSGIADICSINKKNEELKIEKAIIDIGKKKKYRYGLGNVYVEAYLPKSYEGKLLVLLIFRKKGVEDAWITFGHEDAQNILLCKDVTGLMSRKFVLFEDEGKVWLQLLNVRFAVEYSVVENLCILLDDLREEFIKCLDEQRKLLGTEKFSKDEDGDIVLLEAPTYVWEALVEFAQERDYELPYDKWNIFHINPFFRDRILIYKNRNEDTKGDILAQLFCKRKYRNYISIIWRPGFTALDNPCKEFDNKIKWKADYTYDWLIKEFIPRALFEKEKRLFQTYSTYKKGFSLLKRGIYCLKENELND